MNARSLGTLCIVGSGIGIADSVRRLILGQPLLEGVQILDPLTCIAVIIGSLGGLCGLLGFIALQGTGRHPIFRILTFLPAISYTAAIIASLGILTGFFARDPNNPVTSLLWSLSDVLGPAAWLVITILTIAAKSWHGWRRFVPLAPVLAFPLGIAAAVGTGLYGAFDFFLFAALILLGYAVHSAAPAVQLREAMA